MQQTYTLQDGTVIPAIGFGTYKAVDGDEAYFATLEALKAGYRHIDTAAYYENEESIGRAIRDSGIPRDEIFVTTKIWNNNHTYEDAKAAIQESLKKLNTKYIDLLLIHWPNPISVRPNWQQRNAALWKAMEEAKQEGLVRSIGVSNFMPHHLEELAKTATVAPTVNQIRLAPGVYQQEVIDYCKQHTILLEAWAPLGRGEVLEHEVLVAIAKKYDKTPAQIAIAWSLAQGFLPLPKSVTPSRIHANLDVFDISLTQEEVEKITQIQVEVFVPNPDETTF